MDRQVEEGAAKGAGICGIILLVCGLASSISGFVWIGMHGYGGYGLWSGIGFIVAGVLGIVTWWKRHKGVMVGFLVVTIIVIILATIQAIISGIAYTLFKILADPGKCYKAGSRCYCGSNGTYDVSFCDAWTNLVNSLLVITIFSVIGAIVSLAGSIFGCMGVCASTQSQPGAVVVQQPVVMAPPGYVQQPTGAYLPPAGDGPPPKY